MSTVVLFEVEARDGKGEELIALFEEVLPDTRAFDGCEGVSAHRDQDAPNRVVLIERWASRPHYEAYQQWRAERADPRPRALCVGPPTLRYLDDVDA